MAPEPAPATGPALPTVEVRDELPLAAAEPSLPNVEVAEEPPAVEPARAEVAAPPAPLPAADVEVAEEAAVTAEASLPEAPVEPVPAPELFAKPEPALSTPVETLAAREEPEDSVEISAEMTALPPEEKTPLPARLPVAPPPPQPTEDLEITPDEWERSSAPVSSEPSVLVSPELLTPPETPVVTAVPPPPPEPSEPSVFVSPELFTPPERPAVNLHAEPLPPPRAEPSVMVAPEVLADSSDSIPEPRPSLPLDISVTEPETSGGAGLFGAQAADLGEPEAIQQRETGADLFGPPLAQVSDAELHPERPPAPAPPPPPSFAAHHADVPVAPPTPEPPRVAAPAFTPSLADLPPTPLVEAHAQVAEFHVSLDDRPLPEEKLELAGHADDRVELAGAADFISYSQAPTDSPTFEAEPSGEFVVETGSLAEVANQQVLRPIDAPAPAELQPEQVPLASNADFLGSSELSGAGEAWTPSGSAMSLEPEVAPAAAAPVPQPPPELEGDIIEGDVVQGEIIEGVALEEEEPLPLEAEVVETPLAPPSSAPAPIPLVARTGSPAARPPAPQPFSSVAIPPPEPSLAPAPPRPPAPAPFAAPTLTAAPAAPEKIPNYFAAPPLAAPPPGVPVPAHLAPPPAPNASPVPGNPRPPAASLFDHSGLVAGTGALDPVKVRGEHRVILHTVEGQVKRGVLRDADLNAELIELELSPGSTEKLLRTRVKALFFMLAPGEKPAAGGGDKLRVTFKDGRQVSGFSKDYKSASVGFFVVPADSRTNTARIFIFRSAVDVVALD